jgi:hypothetical protein
MVYFYLDVGPMIRRLQQKPDEFAIRHNCVHHRPSRHRLILARDDMGRIVARCNRTEFPLGREQGIALRAAIENWQHLYPCLPVARDPVSRVTNCVYATLTRYFGPNSGRRQAMDTVWAWVTVAFGARSRPTPKPQLRLVSLGADEAERAADASGQSTSLMTSFHRQQR